MDEHRRAEAGDGGGDQAAVTSSAARVAIAAPAWSTAKNTSLPGGG